MVSRPPAGAQPPFAYILGPGGVPLQARGLLLALASGSPGLQPALVAAIHCGGRPAAHILLAAQHSTHARTASYSQLAANSNVTYKCTPHAHRAGSPAPPPPRDARPCSPRSLPRSQCPDCGLRPPPPHQEQQTDSSFSRTRVCRDVVAGCQLYPSILQTSHSHPW